MPEPVVSPTATDLILYAKSVGYDVSPEQIEVWWGLGLLDRGERPGRGRGPGRGPRRFATRERLRALCRIHHSVRPLHEVGWWLWWEGWDVPEDFWRPPLGAAAELFDTMQPIVRRRLLEGNTGELTDLAFEYASVFKTKRTRNRLHRNVRKRLSEGEVETFLKSIFRLCVGIAPLSNVSEEQYVDEGTQDETILKAGFGLHRATVDRLETGERILVGSIREPLADLANAMRFRSAVTATSAASQRIAADARDELRSVIDVLANAGLMLQDRYGKHAFGLGLVQLLDGQRKDDLAMLLAIWVSVGKKSQLRSDARRFLREVTPTMVGLRRP
jgi:hypothetical protein